MPNNNRRATNHRLFALRLLLRELTGIIFTALIEAYLREADRAQFSDLLVNRNRRHYATEEELTESEAESEN
jgi:hypothetical protein